MDKIESFIGEYYVILLVKSVCRGLFLVDAYGVFILRTDVLLYYVEM